MPLPAAAPAGLGRSGLLGHGRLGGRHAREVVEAAVLGPVRHTGLAHLPQVPRATISVDDHRGLHQTTVLHVPAAEADDATGSDGVEVDLGHVLRRLLDPGGLRRLRLGREARLGGRHVLSHNTALLVSTFTSAGLLMSSVVSKLPQIHC